MYYIDLAPGEKRALEIALGEHWEWNAECWPFIRGYRAAVEIVEAMQKHWRQIALSPVQLSWEEAHLIALRERVVAADVIVERLKERGE